MSSLLKRIGLLVICGTLIGCLPEADQEVVTDAETAAEADARASADSAEPSLYAFIYNMFDEAPSELPFEEAPAAPEPLIIDEAPVVVEQAPEAPVVSEVVVVIDTSTSTNETSFTVPTPPVAVAELPQIEEVAVIVAPEAPVIPVVAVVADTSTGTNDTATTEIWVPEPVVENKPEVVVETPPVVMVPPVCTDDDADEAGTPLPHDINQYPLEQIVCDPMGDKDKNTNPYGGLIAELYYLKDHKKNANSVVELIANGVRSEQSLFFSHVNIPTRMFDVGFPIESGELVKNDAGGSLTENFALRFQAQISLGADDGEGEYQFALLSDDGAILKIDGATVVDNDGNHPTRLGCGTSTVTMKRNSKLKIALDYYQGPRHHIALVPLWRKVDSSDLREPLCGKHGNGYWFNPGHTSEPTKAYQALLSRGWKPLAKHNFELPKQESHNPCVTGTAPKISDVKIHRAHEKIFVKWRSDMGAAVMVRVKDLDTGDSFSTTSDNIVRHKQHVKINGVVDSHRYEIQLVTVAESLVRALSETYIVDARK